MPNDLQTRVREVYNWSVQLTAESRDEKWSYYWPDVIRNLLAKLRIVTGALISLIGLQGVGKSSAMKALTDALTAEGKIVMSVKLYGSGNLRQAIRAQVYENIKASYAALLKEEVIKLASKDSRMATKIDNIRSNSRDKDFYNFMTELLGIKLPEVRPQDPTGYLYLLVDVLPKKIRDSIDNEATLDWLSKTETIMIDLPDYSKTDKRAMVRDLDDVQQLWNTLAIRSWRGSLVVFIQKEMFGNHYFFGKMDTVEIKPFTKEEIIEAYLQTFKDHSPFSTDALGYIAGLSRGIFRRFLRYIQVSLEYCMGKNLADQTIGRDLAHEAIPWVEIVRDIEDELSTIFPKSLQLLKKALQIITLLTKQEAPIIQKQIAEVLSANQMDVSRIADKLEAYGYIIRQRQGNEKLVKLNW